MAPSLLIKRLTLVVVVGLGGSTAALGASSEPAGGGKAAGGKVVGYRAPKGCRYPMAGGARTLKCDGGVKLWRDDVSLSCERMTATFDEKGNIAQATCIGAVQIVTAGGTAQGERAHFDGPRNEVQLTGKPRAQTRGNTLKADRIRLDLATNELIVEGNVEGAIAGADTMAGVPGAQGKAP